MAEFGDYIVYVDESGDHSLGSINEQFPVFVLIFCIFPVDHYVAHVVPAVQRLKFEFFGHDMIVLHEREIRKAHAPFHMLQNQSVRADFMDRISRIIRSSDLRVIASVIDKKRFKERRRETNPYHVALQYGLERVFFELDKLSQAGRRTCVVLESRGKAEDALLAAEFERIRQTSRHRLLGQTLEFQFASKLANSSGLQIADLLARPVGMHVLRPDQPNRAWTDIGPKLVRSRAGVLEGYGLKIYPTTEKSAAPER